MSSIQLLTSSCLFSAVGGGGVSSIGYIFSVALLQFTIYMRVCAGIVHLLPFKYTTKPPVVDPKNTTLMQTDDAK